MVIILILIIIRCVVCFMDLLPTLLSFLLPGSVQGEVN